MIRPDLGVFGRVVGATASTVLSFFAHFDVPKTLLVRPTSDRRADSAGSSVLLKLLVVNNLNWSRKSKSTNPTEPDRCRDEVSAGPPPKVNSVNTPPSQDAVEGFPQQLLIVPGAMKSATSTLFQLLASEFPIATPKNGSKESYFFSADMNFRRGREHYLSLYDRSRGQCLLDASASYLPDRRVPKRIEELFPDTKIRIAICLRDPIKRLVSNYLFNRHVLRCEDRTFNEIFEGVERASSLGDWVRVERERYEAAAIAGRARGYPSASDSLVHPFGYVAASDYATHLEAWRKAFDIECFRFVDSKELADPEAVLDSFSNFLGLERRNRAPVKQPHANPTTVPKFQTLETLVQTIRRLPLPTHLRKVVSTFYRKYLKEAPQETLDSTKLYALRQLLAQQNQRVAQLTGLNTTEWCR